MTNIRVLEYLELTKPRLISVINSKTNQTYFATKSRKVFDDQKNKTYIELYVANLSRWIDSEKIYIYEFDQHLYPN